MGFKLFTSTEQHRAAYGSYLKTLDPSLLILTGDPLVFILRPLDIKAYEIAIRDARGVAVRNVYTDNVTARELLRLCCVDIENWPEEWGDKEKAFRFEYGRTVLSADLACDLPPGVCREAAAVLLDTLPLPVVDTAEDEEEGGEEASPFPEDSKGN